MPRQNQTSSQISQSQAPHIPTVLEHIQEFRARLFWVVASVLVVSSVGYAIKDHILAVLTHPLGGQQLYYLTPVGGLSFIIKLCFYFGVLVSVPLIVYHLFKYLQPMMGTQQHSMKRYFFFSVFLASAGASFAYFVSLPAALHFLTDFNINQITAMLTVDAYLTFVTSYLLGAALLFQIPLILLVIDKITPLTPGGLMKYQRHVILVAFILAAIISPTPDIINQGLLAIPIIVMYQFGIMLVWIQHRKRTRAAVTQKHVKAEQFFEQPLRPALVPQEVDETPYIPEQVRVKVASPAKTCLISDFGGKSPSPKVHRVTQSAAVTPSVAKPMPRSSQALSRSLIPERKVRVERPRPLTSIDGILAR